MAECCWWRLPSCGPLWRGREAVAEAWPSLRRVDEVSASDMMPGSCRYRYSVGSVDISKYLHTSSNSAELAPAARPAPSGPGDLLGWLGEVRGRGAACAAPPP